MSPEIDLSALAEMIRTVTQTMPIVDLQPAPVPGDTLYQQKGTWMGLGWTLEVRSADDGKYRLISGVVWPLKGQWSNSYVTGLVYRKGLNTPIETLNEYASMLLWSMLRAGAIHLDAGSWDAMLDNQENRGPRPPERWA